MIFIIAYAVALALVLPTTINGIYIFVKRRRLRAIPKLLAKSMPCRLVMYQAFEAEMRKCIKDGYADRRGALLVSMDAFATALDLNDTIESLPADIRQDSSLTLNLDTVRKFVRKAMAKHTKRIPDGLDHDDPAIHKKLAQMVASQQGETP